MKGSRDEGVERQRFWGNVGGNGTGVVIKMQAFDYCVYNGYMVERRHSVYRGEKAV